MENIISQIFAATALISTLSEDRLPAVLHDDHRAMLIPLIRNTMLNIATKLLPVIDDIDISDTDVAITFNPAIAKPDYPLASTPWWSRLAPIMCLP